MSQEGGQARGNGLKQLMYLKNKQEIYKDQIDIATKGADLRGANLQNAILRGADLQGADLRGVNLQEAKLRGANLQGVKLEGAYLQGADLQGVDLQVADLQKAKYNKQTKFPQGFDRKAAGMEEK